MAGLGRTAVFGSPSLRVLVLIERNASIKFADILECGSFCFLSWVFLLSMQHQLYLDTFTS